MRRTHTEFGYLAILALAMIWAVATRTVAQTAGSTDPSKLPFPFILGRESLLAGNPLAQYAALRELESSYQKSQFAEIYKEIRANSEEFLGFPLAGVKAMSLPPYRGATPSAESPIDPTYGPRKAIDVIAAQAQKTRIVIWAEEHHLPQTRSLYEELFVKLWHQGYHYLAAETFDDKLMDAEVPHLDYESGYYLRDPIFASALRIAKRLGYKFVPYDTQERGPSGDASFRDRTQAQNIKARIFDRDPQAKALIIVGRGHASENVAPDGWTPMASVLKRLTGIDPFTVYAPTMSQRLTPEEEHPFFRFAVNHGLVKEPVVFIASDGRLLGSGDFDAYVFWPRIRIEHGRPDWMKEMPGRKLVRLPGALFTGSGLRLIQAFEEGEPATVVPVDQIVVERPNEKKALILSKGRFWLRTIDPTNKVIAKLKLRVP